MVCLNTNSSYINRLISFGQLYSQNYLKDGINSAIGALVILHEVSYIACIVDTKITTTYRIYYC